MPFCSPETIIVEERFRESLPEIDQLAEDIRAVGQLQPILVRESGGQLILIAGQRRLEACKKLGRQVWWVSQKSAQGMLPGVASSLQLKRMELMENLSRCSFTPVEEARAIAQIDALMKQEYGEKMPLAGTMSKRPCYLAIPLKARSLGL
jgi:ParB family chromosome partitioning protein